MKSLIYQNRPHVLSRVRQGIAEIVDAEGSLTRIPSSELPPHIHIWRGVVPGSVPFQERPRSFLMDLRNRRDVDLAARTKAKRAKAEKGALGHSAKDKSKASILDQTLNAAMSSLPPELAMSMASQLARLKPTRKPSKKKGP